MKILSLTIFIFISACGFQSVYKLDKSELQNENYKQELASIQIKKERKYINQKFVNNLENILNPGNIKVDPKYLLTFNLKETVASTFTNFTGASGRNRVVLTASYSLKNLESGEILSSGEASAKDDFNVQDKRFANYITEESIKLNLTKILAQNIRDLLIKDIAEKNDH